MDYWRLIALCGVMCLAIAQPSPLIAIADQYRPALIYEYSEVPRLKVGDLLQTPFLWAGGFVEVRNEDYFNSEALPNHHWRGFLRIESALPRFQIQPQNMTIPLSLWHESAHASGGLFNDGRHYSHFIWDNIYRNVHYNAMESGIQWKNDPTWFVDSRMQFYFMSRNTPEASSLLKTFGTGFSISGEYKMLVLDTHTHVFLSSSFRYVRESSGLIWTSVAYSNTQGSEILNVRYPVIAELWSLSTAIGVQRWIPVLNRNVVGYIHWIEGHPGGFSDSRLRSRWIGWAVGLNL